MYEVLTPTEAPAPPPNNETPQPPKATEEHDATVPRDARSRYPMQQKLLLALLAASRKLRLLSGHPIKVVSAFPLEKILHNPNVAGRVAEWNIEL
ncbi:hypothetical protein ZWY2020_050941 [Hordeum vulgare]|nr:hypothetical protein ZWY2020_050941 [Hordeum vulgare]